MSLPSFPVRRRIFLVLLGSLCVSGSAFAQTFTQDIDRGAQAYQAKNYAAAAKLFTEFASKYEKDPAFPTVSNKLYYLLALSLAQLKQWNQIPAVVDDYEKAKGTAPDAWGEDLLFLKGRAFLNANEPAEARKIFEQFVQRYGKSPQAKLAQLLVAQSMILAEQWTEAADLLARMRPTARGADWGRYLFLEAYARINANQTDRALDLIDLGHQNWRRLAQITAFELLAVQLAEKLIEEPDKSRAIRSLIRIQPREKLLELQDQQIASLEKFAEPLKKRDPNGMESLLTQGLLDQTKKEREQFAAVENFDSSVRFRIAKAFLDSGRYRETAFVLESMLDQLPPDSIVEQGTVTLAQCYTQIGRSDKVIEVVDKFAEKFPTSKNAPTMFFQKGLALQNQNRIAESNKVLEDFLKEHPGDPLAKNAAFARAFNDILAEKFADAAKRFAAVEKKYPTTDVAANALFWQAQAQSMGKRSDLALPIYQVYLKKYPKGESAAEARYRVAFSHYDLRDFETAIPELETFVSDNPNNPNSAEGRLLLGDAYFGRHDYDLAIATLMKVPTNVGTYREEAYFKVARYYKLADQPDKLRGLLEKFQGEFPDSARLSEAIFQIGQSYAGDPVKQREIYWKALDRFGNDPKQWGVTDILTALKKASSTPETTGELIKRLGETMNAAETGKKRALQLNAAWGLAITQRPTSPGEADETLIAAAPLVDAEVDNPAVLMDIAGALQRAGKPTEAIAIYKEVRRWNPLSPFNQTVFANLGMIAFEQGNRDEARQYFARYLNETPAVDKKGLVLLKLAEIEQASDHPDKALALYERALAEKGVERAQKAAALLAIGEIYLDQKKPDKAIPYLQRIYILYGAFPDAVAKAYLLSGRAFEQRNDALAAARTYAEMLNFSDLADPKFSEQRAEARRRLDALPADARVKAETLEQEKRNAPAGEKSAGN